MVHNALFRTIDDIFIYPGDLYYEVFKTSPKHVITKTAVKGDALVSDWATFGEKVNAEKYLEDNIVLTEDTEADRYNEGKPMYSLIDFRLFKGMETHFHALSMVTSDEVCIRNILNHLSAITSTDDRTTHEVLLPSLAANCYWLALYEKGIRFRSTKLYDFQGFNSMAHVLEYGMQKYSRNNWRKGYVNRFSAADSLYRHLAKIILGEEKDEESGLPHIGHIMCNVMFLVNDLLHIERD